MKVCIYDWARSGMLEANTKYKHNQTVEVADVFVLAKEIFEAGLNVMVYRARIDSGPNDTNDKSNIIIFVDNWRFQQR